MRDAVVFAVLCVHLVGGLTRPLPTQPPRTPRVVVIDLLHDPPWRLALLPGIGRKRARALAQARALGLLSSPDMQAPDAVFAALRSVRGVGPVTVRRLRAWHAAGLLRVDAPARP